MLLGRHLCFVVVVVVVFSSMLHWHQKLSFYSLSSACYLPRAEERGLTEPTQN